MMKSWIRSTIAIALAGMTTLARGFAWMALALAGPVGLMAGLTITGVLILGLNSDSTPPAEPTSVFDVVPQALDRHGPEPEQPPQSDSRTCTYAKQPVVDQWVDANEKVSSLIITEIGSDTSSVRPANLPKWNADMGGSAARPVLELGDMRNLLGSWLVHLTGGPVSAAQAQQLVATMLAADLEGENGVGCQYAGIEINHVLSLPSLSGPQDPDYLFQQYLRFDGADFSGAWNAIKSSWVDQGKSLQPVTVAVLDAYTDIHGLIQDVMPGDVVAPRLLPTAFEGAIETKDHGDMVASVMFWPNFPNISGVGALRMLPLPGLPRYMPVPLPDLSIWTVTQALLALSGLPSELMAGPQAPLRPPWAQVINVSLSLLVPQNAARLADDSDWVRAMRRIRSLQHPPLIVMAAGNEAGMRNQLSDALPLSVVGYDDNPPTQKTLLMSLDPAPQRWRLLRSTQIAAKCNNIQVHYVDPHGVSLLSAPADGSSFATPQVSSVAAMLLAIDPSLSEDGIVNLIQLGAGQRQASTPDGQVSVWVLNAKETTELALACASSSVYKAAVLGSGVGAGVGAAVEAGVGEGAEAEAASASNNDTFRLEEWSDD